jgi:ADP-ribosyl-[dinitrogen reductase] hydrolase
MKERYIGSLLGLACGDAVGTTVEFRPRGSFTPVTDMTGGGPFRLNPGEWTDDTSMALCLAVSLLESEGFDPRDQATRYCQWRDEGYLSSNGRCFDIGNTISGSLQRFDVTGDPYSGSVSPRSAGNGSIMRLAPVPMYYGESLELAATFSAESSKTTHGAQEAIDACRLFGVMIVKALRGYSKKSILFDHHDLPFDIASLAPKIQDIAQGTYREKDEENIRGSGYVVASLEAALWCFLHTSDFEQAILKAVNLGDDADTTAAVCGQLAGAYYGWRGIPDPWLDKLAMRDYIEGLSVRLYDERLIPTKAGSQNRD